MTDPAQILRQSLQRTAYEAYTAVPDEPRADRAAQTGKAFGVEIQVMEDPLADLTDSMEELSGQFEEKALKDIGQRKLGAARNKMSAYVKTVEKWTQIFQDMPNAETIDRLLRQIKREQDTSPRDLLKLLARHTGDASHQHALLEILEQGLAEGAQGAFARATQNVRAAKELLDAEQGDQVRAGINVAREVNARAKTPSEMQTLRDLYRGEVLGFSKPQECFRSLIRQRGAGRLGEALEFLLKGCSADIQSASPSRSPEELRRVMLDLQSVGVLKTILERSTQLVAKMLSEFGETLLLNGEKLTGRIVDLTEIPFASMQNIAELLQSCGLQQMLAKVYFTTRLTEFLRELSPRLFEEGEARFKLIDSAQELLDELIATLEDAEKRAREKEKGKAA